MAEYLAGYRVGAQIKEHRLFLGVGFPQLLRAADPGKDEIFRFVEKAQRPAIKLIEEHHTALMAAYAAGGTTPDVPLARREQWLSTGQDQILWRQAMTSNPRVVWWWGVRSDTGPRGAWCHLCGSMIHGYDVGRGLTAPARKAVMAHRLEHIRDLGADAAQTRKKDTT